MESLMDRYEKKFNLPDSKVKVDESWRWYRFEKRMSVPLDRYKYSVAQLYGRVLDVGAGDGYGAYLMAKNPKVTSVTCLEIQDKALIRMRKNLEGIENIAIVKGIGEAMPFKRKFDCIHCGSTLEHVFNDRAVLGEIKRLLGGLAVLSVPICSPTDPIGHIREYKSYDMFLNLLKQYFTIVTYKKFIKKRIKKTSIVVIVKPKK